MIKNHFLRKTLAVLGLVLLLTTPALAATKKATPKKKTPQKTTTQKAAPKKASAIPVEMDYASLVEKVLPSIVTIRTDRGTGSGFFVSSRGEILTNYHVIRDSRNIFVIPRNGTTAYALVRDIDADRDMTLLVIDGAMGTPFLRISETLPKQGEAVMAVGNPQGLEGTISNGIVSAFREHNTWVQFTAPISPGSSGGALINSRGEVVGMPTMRYKEGQNLNFAIAPGVLRKFFEGAREKGPEHGLAAIRKEAEQGDALKQFFLGFMYEKGDGVRQDYREAMYWYRQAAEQGYHKAQTNLGYLYDEGLGVKRNYQQATYWYQKAAGQGDTRAQCNLGIMYVNGQGVRQDYKQAVYWFSQAAEQGEAVAQYNLGIAYGRGEGVAPNYERAIYWLRKAAAQGDSNAKKELSKRGIYDY